MKRGSFNAIEEYNQIEKYKAENTYKLFLHSHAQEGFVAGNATNGTHHKYKIRINPNGTEHIKRAKVRVSFVALPSNIGTRDGSSAFYFLGLGISRNVYGPRLKTDAADNQEPGCFANSNIVTSFHAVPLDSITQIANAAVVPALFTNVGVALADGSLGLGNNTNTGNVYDGSDQAAMENPAAVPNVSQAAYNISGQSYTHMGMMGKGFDSGYTMCDNPFGKTVEVSFLDHLGRNQAFGFGADDMSCVCIEVQLLPDNQSNDKFTY